MRAARHAAKAERKYQGYTHITPLGLCLQIGVQLVYRITQNVEINVHFISYMLNRKVEYVFKNGI